MKRYRGWGPEESRVQEFCACGVATCHYPSMSMLISELPEPGPTGVFMEASPMATHSSVLAWRIPGTGEPGGLPSMGSHRVGHNWSDLVAAAAAPYRYVCARSCLLFAISWTVACQAPLSMGFSRQEYWSGLSFPPPSDLLYPGIKPASLVSPALAGRFFTTGLPGKPGQLLTPFSAPENGGLGLKVLRFWSWLGPSGDKSLLRIWPQGTSLEQMTLLSLRKLKGLGSYMLGTRVKDLSIRKFP